MAEKKKAENTNKKIKPKTKSPVKTVKKKTVAKTKPAVKKRVVGRPKKTIDYEMVGKLSALMCTQEEIATILGLCTKTLQRDKEFSRIYKKGLENGKMSLRHSQFKIAQKNASMAIFLGKVYLGQKEKDEESTGKEMPTVNIKVVDNSKLEAVMYEDK